MPRAIVPSPVLGHGMARKLTEFMIAPCAMVSRLCRLFARLAERRSQTAPGDDPMPRIARADWHGRPISICVLVIPFESETPMTDRTVSGRTDDVGSLGDLRSYIHHTLCEKEGLVADQFPLTEMSLVRRKRFCGLQFSLQGPRDVRLGAIWASDHNVVYFYDARGERYLKMKLNRRLFGAEAPSRRAA